MPGPGQSGDPGRVAGRSNHSTVKQGGQGEGRAGGAGLRSCPLHRLAARGPDQGRGEKPGPRGR